MLGATYLDVFRRAAETLDNIGVTWSLIGGAALPARGRVRVTRDFDVIVIADKETMGTLVQHLQEAGFAHHPTADKHKLDRVRLYRFWYPVSSAASIGLDIQVPTDSFLESVARHATQVSLSGIHVPVATTEDLILLKLLSFRPIDRADAIELAADAKKLDTEYITDRCRELEVNERWQEVLTAVQESEPQ